MFICDCVHLLFNFLLRAFGSRSIVEGIVVKGSNGKLQNMPDEIEKELLYSTQLRYKLILICIRMFPFSAADCFAAKSGHTPKGNFPLMLLRITSNFLCKHHLKLKLKMFLALSKNNDQILSLSFRFPHKGLVKKKRKKKSEHLNVNASLALA